MRTSYIPANTGMSSSSANRAHIVDLPDMNSKGRAMTTTSGAGEEKMTKIQNYRRPGETTELMNPMIPNLLDPPVKAAEWEISRPETLHTNAALHTDDTVAYGHINRIMLRHASLFSTSDSEPTRKTPHPVSIEAHIAVWRTARMSSLGLNLHRLGRCQETPTLQSITRHRQSGK
ncbi:hypothetical protein BASA81_015887 [Batrachochytrium salamandrivorans]|nr:hypothetical protein BASA81_015887 [Batrachochytrium salamandrivorans]